MGYLAILALGLSTFGANGKISGSLAMMQSLPEGRTKDLAAKGISEFMSEDDPQAALDMATGIGATSIRFEAEQSVAESWFKKDPAAATQWIQSLTVGETKDFASSTFSRLMAKNDLQAAFDMASGIGDSNLRTEAQKTTAEIWFGGDPRRRDL